MGRGRLFLVSALAGAVSGLGHAPFGIWPLALLGLVALSGLVAREAISIGRSAFAAWSGGIGYFAVTLHWIVEPFLVDAPRHGWMAPFALFFMAAGLGLFWAVAGWIAKRTRANPAFSWCLALTAAELARGHVFTGFPWALPAYIWADTPLIQVAAFVGPNGLTLLTIAFASLPWVFMRPMPGSVFAIFMLGSIYVSASANPDVVDAGSVGDVVLVQPNAPQDEKWDPEKAHIFVDRAIELTRNEHSGDIIVWPETAIPYPLDTAAPVLSQIARAAAGKTVFTGINRRTEDGAWFNSLINVGGDGLVHDTYDKVHLVPFGEYIPFRISFIRALAGFSGFGFSSGAEVRLLETPLGRALPLICYEAIFPGHIFRQSERPDYLLQITNDAWFGTFSGPFQHLDQARFRAVEQGLPLIRAANTGVSAVISAEGQILASLEMGEPGALKAALPPPGEPTLYSRTGDVPLGVALLLVLSGLILAGRRNTIAKTAGSK